MDWDCQGCACQDARWIWFQPANYERGMRTNVDTDVFMRNRQRNRDQDVEREKRKVWKCGQRVQVETIQKLMIDLKMPIKISKLNLCLGLKNKKLQVKNLLEENEIDILCMQETEVLKDIDHN